MTHQPTATRGPADAAGPRPEVRRRIAALIAVIAAFLATMTVLPGAPAGAELPPVTDYAADGPYAVTSTSAAQHTIYAPTEGTDHPIILWGNGTGTTPIVYAPLLEHLASHGFIVAAANTTNAGSGTEMLAGIDAVRADPALAAAADFDHIGATGHSQGGGGATKTGLDPRVDTVFPLEPAPTFSTGNLTIPAIFFAGEADTIVQPSWVHTEYAGVTQAPAAYAELAGATHFTAIGDVGGFRAALTAWARWQLGGDETAAALFAGPNPGLASDGAWSAYESNAAMQALDPASAPAPEPDPEGGDAADPESAEPQSEVTQAIPAVAVSADPTYTG
jgi:hypothetical protein